jgi:hypothetical protein
MALRTASVSGDWSNIATWGGSAAPIKGDTVLVNAGVVVTVTTAVAFGLSTATDDLTITGTGQLVVTTGGTLTCFGNILANNVSTARLTTSGVQANAGPFTSVHRLCVTGTGTLTFDTSDSAAATLYGYKMQSGTPNAPNNGLWVMGTSNVARATINANKGGTGGAGYLFSRNGNNTAIGNIDVQYLNATDCSGPSTLMIDVYVSQPNGVTLKDCAFLRCGDIRNGTTVPTNTTFDLQRCTFTSSANTTFFGGSGNFSNAIGSGVRQAIDCVFDKQFCTGLVLLSWTFTRCVFQQGILYATNNKPSFVDCIILLVLAGGPAPENAAPLKEADLTRVILHNPDTTLSNSKFFTLNTSTVDCAVDGVILDGASADGTGEIFSVIGNPAALRTFIPKRVLVLPSRTAPTTSRPQDIISIASGSANWVVGLEHCTGHVASEAMISYSETVLSPVGQIPSLKNNIAIRLGATAISNNGGAQGSFLVTDWRFPSSTGTQVADVVTAAGILGNVGYLQATGAGGYGLGCTITGSPGQAVLNANPTFVDNTRRLATWDGSLGGPGTDAGALARLVADTTQIPVAYAWIMAGWKPTNAALYAYASDGTTPGVIDMDPPPVVPGNLLTTMHQNFIN